ncbi:uncharacterized protein LOC117644423 [Thrips palmi]|uniref:Uncharacterized protein LOC117644423 n=1 Tax=Thrips palmi TaxID=161013 RepID=A0A6P8YZX4_THRPL|nr:uncharacterized protein LOC117644423 [Thrips palmi]
MWWRSHSGDGKVPPPPPRPLRDLPDVAFRMHCALKFGRRWMADRSLELEEFRAMWRPFKGFILHLFLLILMNLTCLCRLDRFMFFTHDALEDFYCNNHFPDGPVNQMITFYEVDSVERLWSFMDYLVEAVGEDDPPAITKDNPLVGRVRFRQLRVRAGPCIVARRPEFAARFDKCYSFFDEATNNSWVDEATRAVFVEHASYNANCNEVCHVGVRFELPPGGGVVPFINIRCAPLMQYATMLDYWILGHEILFSISTFMLTANEWLLLLRHRPRFARWIWNTIREV